MGQLSHDVVVECDETIDRPPEIVWKALTAASAAAVSEGGSGEPPFERGGQQVQQGVQVMRPSAETFMEQRVVDRHDEVMILRMAMTRNFNLPWSAYESTIRVEPMPRDPSRCRVVQTCLATPTDDERAVTGLLRGLILLSLRSLKARVEQT